MQEIFQLGYITHISGENGIGKSTLLKKSCQYLMAEKIPFSYLGHHHGLMENQTCENQVKFFRQVLGQNMEPWLDLFEDLPLDASIYELSEGEKQRLSIACHMNFESKIWILDEPFDSLDSVGTSLLESALIRFISEHKSVLLVDHSFDLRERLHDFTRDLEMRV